MRVAALYDIHGNLPALEAVLDEVQADLVVVGGDVAPGPLVDACFERLEALDVPVRWVMGNGDREELSPVRARTVRADRRGRRRPLLPTARRAATRRSSRRSRRLSGSRRCSRE